VLSAAAMTAEVTAPGPDPARGAGGFANEAALLTMLDGVYEGVRARVAAAGGAPVSANVAAMQPPGGCPVCGCPRSDGSMHSSQRNYSRRPRP
jgi:hypothetical protein